jgi:hypothetical protein
LNTTDPFAASAREMVFPPFFFFVLVDFTLTSGWLFRFCVAEGAVTSCGILDGCLLELDPLEDDFV